MKFNRCDSRNSSHSQSSCCKVTSLRIFYGHNPIVRTLQTVSHYFSWSIETDELGTHRLWSHVVPSRDLEYLIFSPRSAPEGGLVFPRGLRWLFFLYRCICFLYHLLPRTNIEPVELSEEEFQRWVDVGQAISPEMQRAWISRDVKF